MTGQVRDLLDPSQATEQTVKQRAQHWRVATWPEAEDSHQRQAMAVTSFMDLWRDVTGAELPLSGCPFRNGGRQSGRMR